MAGGKKELTLVMVAMAMAMVVMSSMVAGVAAAPSFPLDCSSFLLDGRPVPLKFCCMEVQDQFLLKKSVGIGGYCEAVKAVKLYNGPLVGKELDLALSIPSKCGLSGYHAKGFQCAGTGKSYPEAFNSISKCVEQIAVSDIIGVGISYLEKSIRVHLRF